MVVALAGLFLRPLRVAVVVGVLVVRVVTAAALLGQAASQRRHQTALALKVSAAVLLHPPSSMLRMAGQVVQETLRHQWQDQTAARRFVVEVAVVTADRTAPHLQTWLVVRAGALAPTSAVVVVRSVQTAQRQQQAATERRVIALSEAAAAVGVARL